MPKNDPQSEPAISYVKNLKTAANLHRMIDPKPTPLFHSVYPWTKTAASQRFLLYAIESVYRHVLPQQQNQNDEGDRYSN
jgi:hypothetical protein